MTKPSHPTGVRGLKFKVLRGRGRCDAVAPHWGAWIEIIISGEHLDTEHVAPHWGAWIEIFVSIDNHPVG